MSLQVQRFTEKDRQEWDEFVNQHPEGRFSQLSGYKDVIEKTFAYDASYWLFKETSGEIKAVLPSFAKNSWLMGKNLLSQPFCEYGGLLGNNLTKEDAQVVKQKLSELLVEHKMPFLEVHGGVGLAQEIREQVFVEKPLHQYAILRLSSSEDVWEKKMNRMVRKAIRKAQNSGLECFQETTEESITQGFYPLYLRSMKRLGTPPLPRSFFLNCLYYLGDYMKMFLVKDESKTISALLGFTTGKRVHIISIASDDRYWEKRPNDLVHWEFIKWAADNGYELFDFGPVRYGGQQQFKEKWGVELFDYSYFYLSRKATDLPQTATYSNRAKLLSSVWKRLVPLPFTKVVGPWFRKQLGE